MPLRLRKAFVCLTLALLLGANWAALQTVAWTAMLARHLQAEPLQKALAKTFDGKHPCCLCKAIEAAKKTQKKVEVSQVLRLEFLPAGEGFVLLSPPNLRISPATNLSLAAVAQRPPTPPPRHSAA